jgi:hypothetical protein
MGSLEPVATKEGRYSLNDLYDAAVAKGANEHTTKPSKFLASPQTIELVRELSNTENSRIT